MIKNRKVNIFYTEKEIDCNFLIDLLVRQIKKETSQKQHTIDEKWHKSETDKMSL